MNASSPASRLITFVAAFLAGIACLVYFREEKAFGITTLATIIIGYAAVGAVRLRGPDLESHGDSVYYLGFCLTLVSLSIGFIFLDPDEGTKKLINTFGFGLLATVCGLVLRIVIQNFSSQEAASKDDAYHLLNESYQKLRTAVDSATSGLNGSMEDFVEEAVSITEELSRSAIKGSEILREGLERDSKASIEKISALATRSIAEISDASSRASISMAGYSKEFAEKTAAAGAVIQDASAAINEASGEFKKGAASVKKSIESLAKSTESLSEVADSVDESAKVISDSLGVLDRTAATLKANLDTATQPLREMAEFQTVIERMSSATSASETHMKHISSILADIAQKAATAQKNVARASEEVARLASERSRDSAL